MSAPSPDLAPISPTARVAELYLLVFPVGHLLFLPVGGAMATAADVALMVLVAAWGVDLLARPEATEALGTVMRGGHVPGLPPRRFFLGLLLLATYGALVAASGVWGFHGRYAVAKGMGVVALASGAGALASSGLGWRGAARAWLQGTAAALALTLLLGALGSPSLRERLFHGGSGVSGLPFLRVSGPFFHPNMLGDYLVVSAILLWGVWPDLAAWRRRAAGILGAGMAAFGVLTLSTAWVGAGVAAILLGRRVSRGGALGAGLALRGLGALAAGVTFALLVIPLEVRLAGMELVTSGIRPAIWQGSLGAFLSAPLLGVGAAPFLAEAADPLQGGAPGLWDAHNAYLSVLGQFGVVGLALAATGMWWAVSGALGAASRSRHRTALTLALVAVGVNALFMASEDLRHVWALVGVLGVVGAEGGEGTTP